MALTLLCLHALLHKARRDSPHKNKANHFCFAQQCMRFAALFQKSNTFCHLPYFCGETIQDTYKSTKNCKVFEEEKKAAGVLGKLRNLYYDAL